MTTATYSQPTTSRAPRWLVPGASLALGVSALVVSVVAITTDDVAQQQTVVQPAAIETPASRMVEVQTTTGAAIADDPETCSFAFIGAIDRC